MKKLIILIIAVSIGLLGCTPPINIPPQPTYENKHMIIDTSEACRPSVSAQDTWLQEYYQLTADNAAAATPSTTFSRGGTPTVSHAAAIQKFRLIIECVQTNLETELEKQTAQGWEVTSIQPMDSGPYELGVKYSFIVILKREK